MAWFGNKVTVANVEYTLDDLKKMTDEELKAYSDLVNKKYSATDPNIIATMKNAGYTDFNKFAAALLGAVNSERKGTVFEQVLTDNAAEAKKNPGVEYGTAQKAVADAVNHTAAPALAMGAAVANTINGIVEKGKEVAPTFVDIATQNAPSTGAAGTGVHASKIPKKGILPTPYDGKNDSDTNDASLGHNVSGPLPQNNSNKTDPTAIANSRNSIKGGNTKSSDTGMAGNMNVPKAGGFGEQAGDQTFNYLVNSVGENKGYNQAAQLASQQAATAAAELIGGNSHINANRKGPNETLRLSRLAEALNAREWTPGYRGQVASINQQAGGADVRGYRKAPIETAEMRQQQRTEGYEQNARNLDYNILKIQQQYNAMKAANIDDAVINAFLQTQMTGINQMYAQNMYNWQQQTDLNFAKQKARTIADINKSNPEVAAYLSYILGAGYTQDLLTADYDRAKAQITEDRSLTLEQKELALRTLAAGYLNLSIQPILGGAGAVAGAFKQLPGAIKGDN